MAKYDVVVIGAGAAGLSAGALLAKEGKSVLVCEKSPYLGGRALAAQRKRRAARQAFERVVADDRGELAAQARLGIGLLLENEGRTDEALSEYLKVAFLYAHDEEVAEALFRAGTCLEALGDADKALEQYEEILSKHPRANYAREAKARADELRSSS